VVAMVTGTGREMLLKRSESDQALLDDFLVKPVTASMLLKTVLGMSQSLKQPASLAPMVQKPRLTNMRLLVVEDNLNNQQVARELLQGEGAIVRVANDGRAGVKAVADAKLPFDVVLMDLQMPVMDGFEATRVIRKEMGLHALPIVAMTANALNSDREACLAAGMNEHVGKPFDLDKLVQVLRHQAGWPATEVANTRSELTLPDHVLKTAVAAQVDIEAALHRLGGNQAMYQKLLATFVRDLRAMPAQLEGHLERGKTQDASRLLHTLKGLAATMGASTLAGQAAIAETTMASLPADHGTVADQISAAISAALPGLDGLLGALQSEQQAADTATKASPEPPDAGTLLAMLQTLAKNLQNSDMAALQDMADLQQRFGGSMGEPLAPLQEAMDRLDFASALPLCEALMSRHTA
jgi:CheY-like chemotaxis protein